MSPHPLSHWFTRQDATGLAMYHATRAEAEHHAARDYPPNEQVDVFRWDGEDWVWAFSQITLNWNDGG